ncbi:MAG TPA: MarR family transcriptional regulator [Steroidobacteraceae bacterium]|jgi:DNA-binding MarR family transcriptional regulator|nr:MarR family transcriptional regulator [Steroidobacteraceae bacterium]
MPTMASATQPVTKQQYETLANFRYQVRRFLRYSERVTRTQGVTPLQYQLMLQVQGYPGRDWATVSELAERLQAKHHGVGALLTRCAKRGLLVRNASISDRRSVEVRLTSKGKKTLQRIAQLHLQELVTLQGQLTVGGRRAPS